MNTVDEKIVLYYMQKDRETIEIPIDMYNIDREHALNKEKQGELLLIIRSSIIRFNYLTGENLFI